MKNIIAIIFLFCAVTSNAQYQASVDILGGLNSTYAFFDGNGSVTEIRLKEFLVNKANYHVGFNYNKQLATKLHFKTGLRLVSMGYKSKESILTFANGETNSIYFTYDYLFLELPINLRFEFLDRRKLVPYLETGLATSFYATNRVAKHQEGTEDIYERVPLEATIKSFHLSANVAAGLSYYGGSDSCLFLQLNYKQHLTSLTDAEVIEKQYGYGIEFGIRRNISRSVDPS